MKRNLLIAAIALMAVAFVSCQKDGVYKPKQRIAKITKGWTTTTVYETADGSRKEETVVDPFVSSVWNWGDKTLESVVNTSRHTTIGGVEFVDTKTTYTYDDKNRITGMAYGDHVIEYAYNDDKKMSKITVRDGNELESTIEFGYDGKVVASMVITSYYDYKKCSEAWEMVLPRQIVKSLNMAHNDIQSKDVHTEVTNLTIEWDGKNISQIVSTEENTTVTTMYEYDGKTNPYLGMYGNINNGEVSFMSKNNVIKATNTRVTKENNTSTEVKTVDEYSYEYDGKYPTSVKSTEVYEQSFLGTKYTTTTVTTKTYEYTK